MHLKGHCRFLKLNHCESKVTVTRIGRNCFPRAFVLETPLPDTVWARNLQCSTRYCAFQKLGQPCSFLASWSVFYSVVYCQADLNCFFSSMMGITDRLLWAAGIFFFSFVLNFFFLRSNMLPSFLVRVQDGAGMRLCSSGKKITMYLAVQMELAHHAYHVQWGSILCPTLLEFYICFKFSQIMDL